MLLSLLLLSAPALATIYTTNPVQSTKHVGGEVLNVEWTDNGQAPALSTIGECTVDLCVGSATEQTCIQNLAERVDVSKANSVSATIDPNVGADGDFYFVRYTALNYTENNQDYMQFSARFTMNGMKGTFSSKVLEQINSGNSTASGSMTALVPSSSGAASGSASPSASGSVNGTATGSAAGTATTAPTVASSTIASSTKASTTAAQAPASSTHAAGAGTISASVAFTLLAGLAAYIAV